VINQFNEWVLDETGQLYAHTDIGPVRIDDRDLLAVAEQLNTSAGVPLLTALDNYGVFDDPVSSVLPDLLVGPVSDSYPALYGQARLRKTNRLALEHELGFIANPERRVELAAQHGRHVPLAVKIAPDLSAEQIDIIADLLLQFGIDGVIATNTTLDRDAVSGMPNANEAGGLSGAPLHEKSLQVIHRLRQKLSLQTAIVGVGGIMSGQQALEKIQAGAQAVQLYTGLIYQGPSLVGHCVKAIRDGK
jgi:dihydroorotate dehydrogenase